MVFSVTEENITKLREAGYLAADIAHRLPDEGQIVPTPRPHERVVFLPHFIRGLGFPLHPFVRGLMFYYELDFHDLAPNFILNISAFIIVCEAFLRIKPHFGLWLKTFNVRARKRSAEAPWWEKCQMSPGSRVLCGYREGVAIGVVLHHRAARRQLGGGPRIPIRNPHVAHLLGKEGPVMG